MRAGARWRCEHERDPDHASLPSARLRGCAAHRPAAREGDEAVQREVRVQDRIAGLRNHSRTAAANRLGGRQQPLQVLARAARPAGDCVKRGLWRAARVLPEYGRRVSPAPPRTVCAVANMKRCVRLRPRRCAPARARTPSRRAPAVRPMGYHDNRAPKVRMPTRHHPQQNRLFADPAGAEQERLLPPYGTDRRCHWAAFCTNRAAGSRTLLSDHLDRVADVRDGRRRSSQIAVRG